MHRRFGTFAAVAVLPFALFGCTPTTTTSGPNPAGAPQAAPGGGTAAFCARFGDGMVLNSFATAIATGHLDRAQAAKDLRALGDAAPADIKPDLMFVIDADLALINGEQDGPARMTSPEYDAALGRFTAWWTSHCGVPATKPAS
ncbi:hypothetical protein AB0M43_08320 [Longispora sp. NPDC051575]|uniref:hypothetical protein n=1 Tax=Longispora sp. NPDC051575 TaxID=3154943 RepID=UPI0034257993